MTHRWLVPVLTAALFFAACAPGLIGEDVPLDLAEQTIPGDPTAHAAAAAIAASGVGTLPAMSVTIDHAAQDTSGLTALLLRSVSLEITKDADAGSGSVCWDFVRSITVYIESTVQGSTLPRVAIAQATAPGCVTTAVLDPDTTLNLKPYTDAAFRITVGATGVPPASDVSFVTHLVLRAALL